MREHLHNYASLRIYMRASEHERRASPCILCTADENGSQPLYMYTFR